MNPWHRLRYVISSRGPLLTFRLHRTVYRLSGGRLLSTSGSAMPVLLLTTTGRKTGQPRTWPLNYMPDGDALVIVASNRGHARHPAWYLNLTAQPVVRIQRGGKTQRAMARMATPEERARLWPQLVRLEPLYAQYERDTTRAIPVVMLAPQIA